MSLGAEHWKQCVRQCQLSAYVQLEQTQDCCPSPLLPFLCCHGADLTAAAPPPDGAREEKVVLALPGFGAR